MTKIFWTVSLAALCAAVGCEDLGDQPSHSGSTSGDEGDLDVGSDDSSRCAEGSADAEGCVCTPGALPRACSSGAEGSEGACKSGVQECVTSDSSEIDSSAWGPCQLTDAPDPEGCAKNPGDDCDGATDCDDNGEDDNEGDCCATRLEECLASGEAPAVCVTLDEICKGGTCGDLVTACDPTSLPVSKTCARTYYACFGFRVNKCMRESYDTCLAALGDAALCTAWDAACTAREGYCAQLLGEGGPCETGDPDEGCGDKSGLAYYCTDWGHIFDPCWVEYQACNQDAATCEAAMHECAGKIGDIYEPVCGGEKEPDQGDKDPSG